MVSKTGTVAAVLWFEFRIPKDKTNLIHCAIYIAYYTKHSFGIFMFIRG